jgi:hypothetical protein
LKNSAVGENITLENINIFEEHYIRKYRGSIPGECWEFFSKPPHPERFWGPPSLLSRPWLEADHSPPTSAEVKE